MTDDSAELALGHKQARTCPALDVVAVTPAFDVEAGDQQGPQRSHVRSGRLRDRGRLVRRRPRAGGGNQEVARLVRG